MRLAILFAGLILALPFAARTQEIPVMPGMRELPQGAITGPVDLIDPKAVPEGLASVIAQLHPQQGEVRIGGGLATLSLPKGLAYLPPAEADIYMRRIVGFPRLIKNLGLILPSDIAIGSAASWSSLITYREDGYMKQSDAASFDTAALMTQMKKSNEAHLGKLKKFGFDSAGAILIGWSDKPAFDATHHALIWSTEIAPANESDEDLADGGSEDHRFDFFIRILGRHGTLSLPIVTSFEQLPVIKNSVPALIQAVRFTAPNRYEDIQAGDAAAPYSLADLITGHIPLAARPFKKASPN